MSRAIVAKICLHCGASFRKDPRNTWAYFEKSKYCSQACAGLAWAARARETRAPKAEQFSKWFVRTDGCWNWTGAIDGDGYGIFSYATKNYRAPKVALELDGRPVPAGMYACHTCDNPTCVRPDHLYPGTPTQNMDDAKARGRLAVGVRRSSKLTDEDVIAIRASSCSHTQIASLFGVSRPTVSLIKGRKTWRHLP